MEIGLVLQHAHYSDCVPACALCACVSMLCVLTFSCSTREVQPRSCWQVCRSSGVGGLEVLLREQRPELLYACVGVYCNFQVTPPKTLHSNANSPTRCLLLLSSCARSFCHTHAAFFCVYSLTRSCRPTLLPLPLSHSSLYPLHTAGGSVEPFWGLYQQHQKPEIRDILSKYHIGTLKGAPRASAAVPQVRAAADCVLATGSTATRRGCVLCVWRRSCVGVFRNSLAR